MLCSERYCLWSQFDRYSTRWLDKWPDRPCQRLLSFSASHLYWFRIMYFGLIGEGMGRKDERISKIKERGNDQEKIRNTLEFNWRRLLSKGRKIDWLICWLKNISWVIWCLSFPLRIWLLKERFCYLRCVEPKTSSHKIKNAL